MVEFEYFALNVRWVYCHRYFVCLPPPPPHPPGGGRRVQIFTSYSNYSDAVLFMFVHTAEMSAVNAKTTSTLFNY